MTAQIQTASDFLEFLWIFQVNSMSLHIFHSKNKRLGALNKFKSKSRSVLLATDVASRGLDIPHVDCVINYDIPTHSKVRQSGFLTFRPSHAGLHRRAWRNPPLCLFRTTSTGWGEQPEQGVLGSPSRLSHSKIDWNFWSNSSLLMGRNNGLHSVTKGTMWSFSSESKV